MTNIVQAAVQKAWPDATELLRNRKSDHEPPRLAVWELTLKCNLGCKHCGSRAGLARSAELNTEEALDLVAQMAEAGIREVVLIGGEAYLRPDWHLIAREIAMYGMGCAMVSGGRDLTEDKIDLAARSGVTEIGLSLDGLQRTHDAIRGVPGTYDAAVSAARLVKARGLRLAVNTQINRLSLPELPALAQRIVDLGAIGWQVQITVPMGRAADRPMLLLQPHHILTVIPLLLWIRSNVLPEDFRLFRGNNVGYYGLADELLVQDGVKARYSGCQAGKGGIGIEADGTIKGCPSLPTQPYAGQSIRTERLAKILTSPKLEEIHRRTVDDLWGFCRTCSHAATCMGGCTWTAHTLLGRPGNNPYCYHRARSLRLQGHQEKITLAEAAPGLPFDYGRYEIETSALNMEIEDPEIDPLRMLELIQILGPDGMQDGAWSDETIKRILAIPALHRKLPSI